ncbi:MAG: glycerophosphodiester phosphodiesterase family protein [bacterium]
MKKNLVCICMIIFILTSLKSNCQQQNIDVQGHRGCRGYMPENSIPGFIEAVKLKVNTLEMDVVISQDKKVVVSHEPWMNAEICLNKNGKKILIANEKELNIFKMNYDEIANYDCGSLLYNEFPSQKKINVHKPTLSEVADSVLSYCKSKSNQPPFFNIEIKSRPDWDNIYTPPVEEFCEIVIAEINRLNLLDKSIIQSFDRRALRYIHEKYPSIRLSFLTEDINDMNEIERQLSFLPEIYSPAKELVSPELIRSVHSKSMKITPWTVNDESRIAQFIEWGVDGIITDYPDKVKDRGVKDFSK